MEYVYLVYLSEPWKDYLEAAHATERGASEHVESLEDAGKKAFIVKMNLDS